MHQVLFDVENFEDSSSIVSFLARKWGSECFDFDFVIDHVHPISFLVTKNTAVKRTFPPPDSRLIDDRGTSTETDYQWSAEEWEVTEKDNL